MAGGGEYEYGVYPYGGGGDIDTVEEHYHLMNHRPKVDGMYREDMMVEVEMVERELECVVLARHWTGDRAARHRQAHREREELTKSGCSKDHTTFTSQDSNCSS
jgi:hypothetical protein